MDDDELFDICDRFIDDNGEIDISAIEEYVADCEYQAIKDLKYDNPELYEELYGNKKTEEKRNHAFHDPLILW